MVRLSMIFVGTALAIGGLIWGLTSQQINYQQVNAQSYSQSSTDKSYPESSNYHIGTGTSSGNVYINANGSDEFFVAFNGDFSPPIATSDIDNTSAVSFIARTDYASLDLALNANGITITRAHRIDQLVLYDQNGSIIRTYTSIAYSSNNSAAYHIALDIASGNVYMNQNGSSNYFIAFNGDFNVPITQNILDNGTAISFIARADYSRLSPALNTSNGSINQAHKIERLIFYGANGNVIEIYTSAEYNANPNGSYLNNWPLASVLLLVGLIVGGSALIYPIVVKKPQVNTGYIAGVTPVQPYQQYYAQQNPYGQAYPPPQQYPPTLPYPPQPPAYGQPGSNPYQQPPQP